MERNEDFSTNRIIYDWLSFTTKIHTPEEVMSLLGLSGVTWQKVKGAHGYQDRYYFESISIHFNGREDMGVWCEMSGQGCRAYETFGRGDFEFLFNTILSNENMNITRLDVAFDDHTGILDIDKMCQDVRAGNFVSRFNAWQVIESTNGNSILHGSKKSEIIVRIYDKAKERGYTDDTHWIRVEIQMRRDRAENFIKQEKDLGIGYMFTGVLNSYLRYISPSTDTNLWRRPMRKYWQKLVQHAERVKLYTKPGMDYNLSNLDNFIEHQAGGAIQTYAQIHGIYALLDRTKKDELNPKYEELLREYGKNKAG